MTASIGSISAARTALSAHQAAIAVISDNLANATIYGAGRNDVALALAARRDSPVAPLGGRTLADTCTASVSRFGGDVRAADDAADTHAVLASQADIRRASVSGVSTDEELVQLTRFQNAYSAAAHVVSAADEMLQTILDMKR